MVYVDVDGVVADLVRHMKTFHDKPDAVVDRWDLASCFGIPEEECWDLPQRFWETIPLTKDWEQWIPQGPFTLLGNSNDEHCTKGKKIWLQKWFPHIKHIIEEYSHKNIYCKPGDVLIDDKQQNCDEWIEAGGTALLVRRPWSHG